MFGGADSRDFEKGSWSVRVVIGEVGKVGCDEGPALSDEPKGVAEEAWDEEKGFEVDGLNEFVAGRADADDTWESLSLSSSYTFVRFLSCFDGVVLLLVELDVKAAFRLAAFLARLDIFEIGEIEDEAVSVA